MSSSRDLLINIESLPEVNMVELPCYLAGSTSEQQKKAHSLLGGDVGLERALLNGSKLLFRFPSDNALRSCVVAEKTGANGLLLRLRRKKVKNNVATTAAADSPPYEAQVVARVRSSYAFPTPFDFAFLPSSSGLLQTPGEMVVLTSTGDPVAELAPRPFFHDGMRSQGASGDADYLSSADTDKEWHRKMRDQVVTLAPPRMPFISFNDSVPPAKPLSLPEQENSSNNNNNNGVKATVSCLQELLDRRPVVQRRLLEDFTDLFTREPKYVSVDEVLVETVYGFRSGPYTKTLLRLGYDCRRHPTARIYQSLVISIKEDVLRSWSGKLYGRYALSAGSVIFNLDSMEVIANAHSTPVYRKVFDSMRPPDSCYRILVFGTLLSAVMTVQICNLFDENVFQVVAGDKRNAVCVRKSGWFPDKSEATLRDAITVAIGDKIEALCNRPVDAAEGGEPVSIASTSSSSAVSSAGDNNAVAGGVNIYDLLNPDSFINRWHSRYLAVGEGSGTFEAKKDRRVRLGFPARQLSRQNAISRAQARRQGAAAAAKGVVVSGEEVAAAETYYMSSGGEEDSDND